MADNKSRWLDGALLLLGILLAGWISTQFGQLAGQTTSAGIATNYQTMAIISLIVLAISGHFFFEFLGLNGNQGKSLQMFAIGGAVGFIMTATGKLLLTKLLSNSAAIDPGLGFAFVVILAPLVETYFFVGVLYPSFKKFISGKTSSGYAAIIIAALLVAGIAAVFHTVAANGSTDALTSYFILFLVFIGLAEATKSIEASLMAHAILNLITGG
jgi:membrane protease YdiL (CAAX protease family)